MQRVGLPAGAEGGRNGSMQRGRTRSGRGVARGHGVARGWGFAVMLGALFLATAPAGADGWHRGGPGPRPGPGWHGGGWHGGGWHGGGWHGGGWHGGGRGGGRGGWYGGGCCGVAPFWGGVVLAPPFFAAPLLPPPVVYPPVVYPPVIYPPAIYPPPSVVTPGIYPAPPEAYYPPLPPPAPVSGRSCRAGAYVCPAEGPLGAACRCPGRDGRPVPGRIG